MSKYYLEEESERIELVEHMNKQSISNTELKILKYLKEVLKTAYLSDEMLKVFIEQFYKIAGSYSVLTDKDTIIGMYNFMDKNNDLSPAAINKLWSKYIKDLFDDYKIEEKYQELLNLMGKDDSTYEMFLIYVNNKGKKLQAKYEKEALKLVELNNQYSEKFVNYLKSLILRKHMKYANIVKCLPDPSIIEQDENQLREIAIYHRIDFGTCYPISYTMVEALAKENSLDEFDEEPKYYVDISKKEYKTTFTKSDFLKHIKEKNMVKE